MVSRCRPAGKRRSHQSEIGAIWKKDLKEEEEEVSVLRRARPFFLSHLSVDVQASRLCQLTLVFCPFDSRLTLTFLACSDDVIARSSRALY